VQVMTGKIVTVRLINLNAHIAEHRVWPRFIKIDAEGAEYAS